MRGLDTNILVRFLTRDDPEQARTVRDLFERADYLIGWQNRRAGCEDTLTFDGDLEGSPGFTLLS